ncbi:hypothetical protein Ahy_A01g003183 [Arachis hypogaea]|uniref:Uncharacterized protein n=1 Tax=Arachis hypogaea TaxID=3818 RepID=A0A445ESC9_ARAHY|nr:hypothetical protein Ahy_A01g003183 [Arachis hypogaea]
MEKGWFNSMLFYRQLEYRCGLSNSMDSFGPVENTSASEDPILIDMEKDFPSWNDSDNSSYMNQKVFLIVRGEMPLEPRASWFSPKCVEAQQLTGHLGVKHCFGPTGQGTISGRQFLWGVGLQKGNGGVQRFPRARRRLALECKGRRELDCKTHPSSRDESRP